MLTFHCYFCGYSFSNNYGPFVWVSPQCPNCGSTSVGYSDEPEQPEYDMEELLEWAEIGRRVLSDESEFVENPMEEAATESRAEPVGNIVLPKESIIRRLTRGLRGNVSQT